MFEVLLMLISLAEKCKMYFKIAPPESLVRLLIFTRQPKVKFIELFPHMLFGVWSSYLDGGKKKETLKQTLTHNTHIYFFINFGFELAAISRIRCLA